MSIIVEARPQNKLDFDFRGLPDSAKALWLQLLRWAGKKGYCWWSQQRMAEHFGWSARKLWGCLKRLTEAGLLVIKQRGLGRTAHYVPQKPVASQASQTECEAIYNSIENKARTTSSRTTTTMAGSVLTSDATIRETVSQIPRKAVQMEDRKEPLAEVVNGSPVPQKQSVEAVAVPVQVVGGITDEEYVAFRAHCTQLRLETPSRIVAAEVKRKYVGTWAGQPAWLQLPLMFRQKTAGWWLKLDREQVLYELERQALTPPPLSPAAERQRAISMDRIRRIKAGLL